MMSYELPTESPTLTRSMSGQQYVHNLAKKLFFKLEPGQTIFANYYIDGKSGTMDVDYYQRDVDGKIYLRRVSEPYWVLDSYKWDYSVVYITEQPFDVLPRNYHLNPTPIPNYQLNPITSVPADE